MIESTAPSNEELSQSIVDRKKAKDPMLFTRENQIQLKKLLNTREMYIRQYGHEALDKLPKHDGVHVFPKDFDPNKPSLQDTIQFRTKTRVNLPVTEMDSKGGRAWNPHLNDTQVMPKIEPITKSEVFHQAAKAHKAPVRAGRKILFGKPLGANATQEDSMRNDHGYNHTEEDLTGLQHKNQLNDFYEHLDNDHSEGKHEDSALGNHPHCSACITRQMSNV